MNLSPKPCFAMRNSIVFLLVCFLSLPVLMQGQTYHTIVLPTSGTPPFTQFLGPNRVEFQPIYTNVTTGTHCGFVDQFSAGNPSGSGFGFEFDMPISHLRLQVVGLDLGEEFYLKINGADYFIQNSDVSGYSSSCSSPNASDIVNGRLTTLTGALNGKTAELNISVPGSIRSLEVLQDNPTGTSSGSIFQIHVVNDTCYFQTLTAMATSTVCLGDTLFLSGDLDGGTNYNWFGPNGHIGQVRDTFITPITSADSGRYFLTAERGGCSYTDDTVVNVPNLPVPDGTASTAPVCAGAQLELSTDNRPGMNFYWEGPAGFQSTQQNPIIASVPHNGDGWYYVHTEDQGCLSMPDSVHVTLLYPHAPPKPSVPGPVCPGTDLHLSSTPVPGGSYQWYGPNQFSAQVQNPTRSNIQFSDEGYYYVTVTVNGCISRADSVFVPVEITTPTPKGSSNSPVCLDTDLDLQVDPMAGASYEWRGPGGYLASGASASRSSMQYADAGHYLLWATVAGCRSKPDTVEVEVDILTPTPKTADQVVICPGLDLTLTALEIPGARYYWEGPQGFEDSVREPTVPFIRPENEGFYRVRALIDDCYSQWDSVYVKVDVTTPQPQGTANGPICAGETLKLTAKDQPADFFEWQGPGGWVSQEQNPEIPDAQVSQSGIYILRAKLDGCFSLPDTVMVRVKLKPELEASTNSPVCERDTLFFHGRIQGEYPQTKYTWRGPNGFVASGSPAMLTPTAVEQTGTYIGLAQLEGCLSDTVKLDVVVHYTLPDPVASHSGAYNGDTLFFWGEGLVEGTDYHWIGPDGFEAEGQSPYRFPVNERSEGVYTLYAYFGGCISFDTVQVKISMDPFFQLYPNPNNGRFRLKGDLGEDRALSIHLINSMGQVVRRTGAFPIDRHINKEFQWEDLPAGVYLLRMEMGKHTRDLRFVVQH